MVLVCLFVTQRRRQEETKLKDFADGCLYITITCVIFVITFINHILSLILWSEFVFYQYFTVPIWICFYDEDDDDDGDDDDDDDDDFNIM